MSDLDPDVVLTQDLCAVCAVDVQRVDDALAHLGCGARVVTLDPQTLDAVLDSIAEVGAALGAEAEATELVSSLRGRLDRLGARRVERAPPSGAGAGMDRPALLGRTLGSRPRQRRWRPTGDGQSRRPIRSDSTGTR